MSDERDQPFRQHLEEALTTDGGSLADLSDKAPVLVVFLRHAGCTFCRETLADLAKIRHSLEGSGTRLALVHMGTEQEGADMAATYGLEDVPRISDPDQTLYRAFGLKRAKLRQLLGPRVWVRGFKAAILSRHGFGRLKGDGLQMPGAFLLHRGEILKSFRHEHASDRPDYQELASCELPPA